MTFHDQDGQQFTLQSITLGHTVADFDYKVWLADDGKRIKWEHSNGKHGEIPLRDAGLYSDVAIRQMGLGERWEKAQFTYNLKHVEPFSGKVGGIYNATRQWFYVLKLSFTHEDKKLQASATPVAWERMKKYFKYY